MTDKEQITNAIREYMNLLRIEQAENRDAEIANQLCESRAKLEALGIVAENLKIVK